MLSFLFDGPLGAIATLLISSSFPDKQWVSFSRLVQLTVNSDWICVEEVHVPASKLLVVVKLRTVCSLPVEATTEKCTTDYVAQTR